MRERKAERRKKARSLLQYQCSWLTHLRWEGDTARIKPFIQGQKEWKKGMIVERLDERSYEVETADGSSYTDVTRSISNERMSRPLSWPSRNYLKYQVILMTPVTEYIWRNRLPLRKPHACIELCKDTLEQDLVGMTRTHSGRIVKTPGHFKGLCDLKTCHWTLNFKPTIGIWV